MLGNISGKYRARLKDVQLALFFSISTNSEIQPLIDDIKVLESIGLNVDFEGKIHNFKGTVTMVVARNLAAPALARFFCNFSTVQKCVAFVMLQNSA